MKSRRSRIIEMFYNEPNLKITCQEITKKIIKSDGLTGNVALYLSGSISSILAKLVKEKILKYDDEKTARGGHIYCSNIPKNVSLNTLI